MLRSELANLAVVMLTYLTVCQSAEKCLLATHKCWRISLALKPCIHDRRVEVFLGDGRPFGAVVDMRAGSLVRLSLSGHVEKFNLRFECRHPLLEAHFFARLGLAMVMSRNT